MVHAQRHPGDDTHMLSRCIYIHCNRKKKAKGKPRGDDRGSSTTPRDQEKGSSASDMDEDDWLQLDGNAPEGHTPP